MSSREVRLTKIMLGVALTDFFLIALPYGTQFLLVVTKWSMQDANSIANIVGVFALAAANVKTAINFALYYCLNPTFRKTILRYIFGAKSNNDVHPIQGSWWFEENMNDIHFALKYNFWIKIKKLFDDCTMFEQSCWFYNSKSHVL